MNFTYYVIIGVLAIIVIMIAGVLIVPLSIGVAIWLLWKWVQHLESTEEEDEH